MPIIPFHSALRAKVQEEIGAELERMGGGYADYNVYKEAVGYLKGLKTVLDIAEDIEKGMT
jgi:hypothetical protein